MTKANRKNAAIAAPVFNMEIAADLNLSATDDELMASLMSDIDNFDPSIVDSDDTDEINEMAAEDAMYAEDDLIESASIEVAAPEDTEEAACAELEKDEATHAMYADDADSDDEVSEADKPATDEVVEAPAKKVKGKKEPKVKAEKVAKEPKEPKAPSAPRVTYVGHTTSEVLAAKLGDKRGDLLTLEVADIYLDPDALTAKQDLILVDIDSLAKKVGEKAVMLFSYMKNGGKLNDVMARAFTVLARDGELVMGQKGNLHINLMEKFSKGTADSQGNQMAMLFPFLKVATKEKGILVANPNSLILMKVRAELGIA